MFCDRENAFLQTGRECTCTAESDRTASEHPRARDLPEYIPMLEGQVLIDIQVRRAPVQHWLAGHYESSVTRPVYRSMEPLCKLMPAFHYSRRSTIRLKPSLHAKTQLPPAAATAAEQPVTAHRSGGPPGTVCWDTPNI